MKQPSHRERPARERLAAVLGSGRTEAAAFVLLLAVPALVPIPFGGITPEGRLVVQALSFLIALLTFSSPAGRAHPLGPVRVPAALVAGLGLLGLLQLLPLPEALLGAVSPRALAIYREAAATASALGGPAPLSPRISISPGETWDSVLLVLACAALLLSSFVLLRLRLRRRLFFGALLAAAAVHVLVAVASKPEGDRLAGPFVNPNHFAGWLEIALPVAVALLFLAATRPLRPFRKAPSTDLLERRLVAGAASVLLLGTLATGLGLTRSRGGLLAALAAAAFLLGLLVLFPAHAPDGRRAALRAWLSAHGTAFAALAAALLFVAVASGSRPLLRFVATDPRDLDSDSRLLIWRLSVAAWKEFPVLGSGLGSYLEAFRPVQPAELPGFVEWAHSDPLQLLVTGGLVGLALAAAAWVALFLGLARALQSQPHREERAFALAGLAALLSLGLHGFVEFNLSLPAIPATLAAVCGASLAATAWRRHDEADEAGEPAPRGTTLASTKDGASPESTLTEKNARP